MLHARLRLVRSLFALSLGVAIFGCAAGRDADGGGGQNTGGSGGGLHGGCPVCELSIHKDCNGNTVDCSAMGLACDAKLGCVTCAPGAKVCVGNEVHDCGADGQPGGLVEMCDVNAGLTCSDGACKTACQVAADQPSNIGCEFWAVDLDQQDAGNNPADAPWGVALSNAGQTQANVTIEINEAPVGAPQQLTVVKNLSVPVNTLSAVVLPTRELDCGAMPNDYASPGTCLSSRAFRITSSSPIVVYQFNVFANAYSNDASLLLPTNALGQTYRVIGWGAAHPVALGLPILDRSYVTIVGTAPNTTVKVKPSWRIKGNAPIAATPAGGMITATIGPFDVLNLETDDGTFQDDPKTMADLSGTYVTSDKPVAVFSGVETAGAPGWVDIPKPPGWDDMSTPCCLDHLEDQLFPVEAIGTHYVIARSPVRSTGGSYREPDVIRFVGAAEAATVTTSLPAPYDSFTLQPGEVKTTWTQNDFVASADKPFTIGQIIISQSYVDGPYLGDPSLTTFPPVEQYRSSYTFLAPMGWTQSWVVISGEAGGEIKIDGSPAVGCTTEASGNLEGVAYASQRCPLQAGVHTITSEKVFGVVAYGYGTAGSYAVAGGAAVKPIYVPPPPPA